MKRVMIAFLFLLAGPAAIWCWSFAAYQEAMEEFRAADANGDITRMEEVLAVYDTSFEARIVAEVPFLERRVRTIRALIAIERGDELASAEAFAGVIIGGKDILSAQALYNRGNLMTARAQLEAAKESYARSLRLNPGDLQAKINLELLLRKIAQQQKGREGEGLLDTRKAILDYWLREDGDGNPEGKSSEKNWR